MLNKNNITDTRMDDREIATENTLSKRTLNAFSTFEMCASN